MSAEELRRAILRMPSSGTGSFEDLVAHLLSQLLDQRFVLSRSGSQPSGDARSQTGETTIECKRYEEPDYDLHRIEGQLQECIRTEPHLDLCVIAVTAPKAQLDRRLQSIEEATGVDVFSLSMAGDDSDLVILCVSHWGIVGRFPPLEDTAQSLRRWAVEHRQRPESQQRLQRLRDSLLQRLRTYDLVVRRGRERLERRFTRFDQPVARSWHPIHLDEAVVREALLAQFQHWWNTNPNSILCLRGEEGVGKTWAAAQMANWLSGQRVLVLWLDSRDWFQARTLDDALRQAFRLHLRDPDETVNRLARKALWRWRQPTVLFLDGVNERGALDAATHILDDLFDRQSPLPSIRLVFTSRSATAAERRWDGCTGIEMTAYSDQELAEALALLQPPIRLSDLPAGLLQIARIPRYLSTCVKLRDRLGSLESVSLEVVLWQDLIDRIESADWQVTERLGVTTPADARELLSELAQRAAQAEDQRTLGLEELNRCFAGQYERVRQDILELRMADARRFEARINQDHLILGWALWILSRVTASEDQSSEAIADVVRQSIEPLANEDRRTEAIYTALLIGTASMGTSAAHSPSSLAGLMTAWIPAPNAQHLATRLDTLVELDTEAFCHATDSLLATGISPGLQRLLSASLARLWRNGGSAAESIRPHLERWVVLTLDADDQWPGEVVEHEGHRFPKARSQEHLRAAAMALSLLSLQPEPLLLHHLALARATLTLSRDSRGGRLCAKDFSRNFGLLMRWAFTESIAEDISRLPEQSPEDELLGEGASLLAADLALAEPPVSRRPQSPDGDVPRFVPWDPEEALRSEESLLRSEGDVWHAMPRIAGFAIRTDLPSPTEADRLSIQAETERLASSGRIRTSRNRTHDDMDFDELLPWYARLFPERVPGLLRALWSRVLASVGVPRILATEIEPYVIRRDDQGLQELLQRAREVLEAGPQREPHFEVLVAKLTAFVAQHGEEQDLRAWLDLLAASPQGRMGATYLPLPTVLRLRLNPDSVGWARMRAEVASLSPPATDALADERPTQFEYWCYVASCAAGEDQAAHAWALARLRSSPAEERTCFHLWLLLARTGPPGWFEEVLRSPDLCQRVDDQALRALWLDGDEFLDAFDPTSTQPVWDCHGSAELRTALVLRPRGGEELAAWGELLVNRILQVIDAVPPLLCCDNLGRLRVDGAGRPKSWSTPNRSKTVTLGEVPVSSWGIEEGDPDEFTRLGSSQDRDREHEEAFQRWTGDLETLRGAVGSDVFEFSGRNALLLWAHSCPGRFMSLVQALETTLGAQPANLRGLGLVADAVAAALLRVDPKRACRLHRGLESCPGSVRVTAEGGTRLFAVELWRLGPRGNSTARECMDEMLQHARSDEEIMELTLAGLVAGEAGMVIEMARALLTESLARERALGVSMLAWVGTEEAIEILEWAGREDPSLWVRDHATWANRVVRSDCCCRAMYREALDSGDALQLSAALMTLRPALTPAAHWWHLEIEEDVLSGRPRNPESEVTLMLFWSRSMNLRSSRVEIMGRVLRDHCRGERLDAFVSPRMAPWWDGD